MLAPGEPHWDLDGPMLVWNPLLHQELDSNLIDLRTIFVSIQFLILMIISCFVSLSVSINMTLQLWLTLRSLMIVKLCMRNW